MSLYLSPMFYGIEDHLVPDATPFALRIYYPTNDDTILGSPLLKGPHPLVVFVHGERHSTTNPALCPPEFTRDNQRWSVVLGGIARSGYVVASPNVQGIVSDGNSVASRISKTVNWMRSEWGGRGTIHKPPIANPGTQARPLSEKRHRPQSKVVSQSTSIAAIHVPPVVLGEPTALALVCHSWGVRGVSAFAVANSGVTALVTIAGTMDDDQDTINNIRQIKVPNLMMCGTVDGQTFAPMKNFWPGLPTPKYQTAFQGVEHWDWFGRFGAIRRCDGTPPTWRDTGHIAGELIAGFFARHVALVKYPPPDLVRIPILRPNGIPWCDFGSAFQMRWDAPGQNFDTLPTTGDGNFGPWTESSPWL